MNSPPIVEPMLVVELVDVHWGLTDLDFDPWQLRNPFPLSSNPIGTYLGLLDLQDLPLLLGSHAHVLIYLSGPGLSPSGQRLVEVSTKKQQLLALGWDPNLLHERNGKGYVCGTPSSALIPCFLGRVPLLNRLQEKRETKHQVPLF